MSQHFFATTISMDSEFKKTAFPPNLLKPVSRNTHSAHKGVSCDALSCSDLRYAFLYFVARFRDLLSSLIILEAFHRPEVLRNSMLEYISQT